MSSSRKKPILAFGKYGRADSEKIVWALARRLSDEVQDSYLGKTLLECFEANTLHLLPEDPSGFCLSLSLRDIKLYRQILALRSKSDDIDLGIDRRAAAWESYCKSELACASTNRRLSMDPTGSKAGVSQVLYYATRKILDILGDAPALCDLRPRFGPGANVSCRQFTNARHKLSAPLGLSMELYSHREVLAADLPLLFDGREPVIEIAEVSMVPKNAKTMRTIEFQPLLNTMYQLGIGSLMKHRLRRSGIDLFDQERNRSLARLGSFPGSGIATVDFSSASDTISGQLVVDLLPSDWVDLLAACRVSRVRKSNLTFTLCKWSAMGNGYTFELESLIFYSLAYGVCKEQGVAPNPLSIYGDDLIIPSTVRSRLIEVFSHFGLTINDSKSFWDGPFRESCGADYFLGHNIRPSYLKGRLRPIDLFRLRNHFYRDWEFGLSDFVEALIPAHLRVYGPDFFGDGHLVSDSWKGSARVDARLRARQIRGRSFHTWTIRPRENKEELPNDRYLPAYTAYLSEEAEEAKSRTTNPFDVRGGYISRKITVVALI